MQAELCGFSLAVAPNEACYVPLSHRQGGEGGKDSLFPGEIAADQLAETAALETIKPLLEDAGVLKIGQNLKFDWQIFAVRGIEIKSYDDTMLMSYVVDAGRSDHGLDPLARRYFDHETIDFNEVTKVGKSRLTFDYVDIAKATEYAAEDADVTLRLWLVLKPRLAAEHVLDVYETLERPLLRVLADMERRGISIDRQILSRLSGEFAQECGGLRSRDQHACRRAGQCRLAEADRRHSVRQARPCRAAPRPRPGNGRPARGCSKSWPSRATRCRKRFSTGARSPS